MGKFVVLIQTPLFGKKFFVATQGTKFGKKLLLYGHLNLGKNSL
jgi:hypothetical protein